MNVLITGGASGLGEAITRAFAKQEINTVYFTYCKSKVPAIKIAEDFRNAVGVAVDFQKEESVMALVKSMDQMQLDVLVNNAYGGTFVSDYFHKIPSARFISEFKENVVPVIEITGEAVRLFRAKGGGRIVTILTAAIQEKAPIGSSLYVSGKGYLQQLVKAWALENARFSITSNSVSPSFMKTGLTAGLDERVVDQIRESHPLKKILTVEDVADAVLYLSRSPLHVNGIDLRVG